MLDEFIKYVLGEWRMIARAPVNFGTAVIVAGLLIWGVMTWGYGRENSFLREQVAAYKDRLSGASPDEAKARIDALEKLVDTLKPRHLTPEQRRVLTERARISHSDRPLVVGITLESSCADCAGYAADFQRSLQDSGWAVGNGVVMGPSQRPPVGLGLVIPQNGNFTALAQGLEQALRAAKIDFDIMHGGRSEVIQLLITSKSPL